MNELDSPSTPTPPNSAGDEEGDEAQQNHNDMVNLGKWNAVVNALKKLSCTVLLGNQLRQITNGLRTKSKCSVEGCQTVSPPLFLARLPTSFELAFHCIASSYSTIVVQNRVMTKLFNKAVLTRTFVNNQRDFREIPSAVVDSFPFLMCQRHFKQSPEYYDDFLNNGQAKPLLLYFLPRQPVLNSGDRGHVRQRAYLLNKLKLINSKILPDIGADEWLTQSKTKTPSKFCAIEDCSAHDPLVAINYKMLMVPQAWQQFNKWERAVWFGLQRNYSLPSHGFLCSQHFTEVSKRPVQQEAPILFHSVAPSAKSVLKPMCVIPSCKNHSKTTDDILFLPFPSSPTDRNQWVIEIRKHHPSFILSPKKRVEWLCGLHFTDLSNLEMAMPSVNLGSGQVEQLSIASSGPSSQDALRPPAKQEKITAVKRKCCFETVLIFNKLAKLQEKSSLVYKLLEKLYIIYGLTPPLEETYDIKKDNILMYGEFGGDEIVSSIATALNEMESSLIDNKHENEKIKEYSHNTSSSFTLADALADIMAQK